MYNLLAVDMCVITDTEMEGLKGWNPQRSERLLLSWVGRVQSSLLCFAQELFKKKKPGEFPVSLQNIIEIGNHRLFADLYLIFFL